MDRAKELGRWLQKRRLLRFLPIRFIKHYVYPLTVRRSKQPYDAKAFFDSWYSSAPGGEFSDRMTIDPGYGRLHTRFHYNAIENSIIRFLDRKPDFEPSSVLDVGSGAGHWIDFYLDVVNAQRVCGLELSETSARALVGKYANDSRVDILTGGVGAEGLDLGRSFDLVNAIGVLFHIVDDVEFERALSNLARHLASGGFIVASDQLGWISQDVQFSNANVFGSWDEHERTASEVAYVNKRIRSLRRWKATARRVGLRVETRIRSGSLRGTPAPEANLVVLSRSGS